MNRKKNPDVLPTTDWAPDSDDTPKTSLIVTAESGLFEKRFARDSGKNVFIADNVESALFLMGQLGSRLELLFADFHPSKDIWSGLRFLRYIKSTSSLQDARVYLMSEKPLAHQVQWHITVGAAGLIKRDPGILTDLIYSHASYKQDLHQTDQLRRIEHILDIFAGHMRRFLIPEARKALALSGIAPTAENYIDALESKLSLPDHKAQFRKLALQAIESSRPFMPVQQAAPGLPLNETRPSRKPTNLAQTHGSGITHAPVQRVQNDPSIQKTSHRNTSHDHAFADADQHGKHIHLLGIR